MLTVDLLYKVLVRIFYKIVRAWKAMRLKSSSKKKQIVKSKLTKVYIFKINI